MRSRYKHHIRPTEAELSALWENAVLTTDANVLLDLYRYHEPTRERMFGALEHFRGRVWISHQASSEFMRNRSNVIADTQQVFGAANKHLDTLSKALTTSLNQLNTLRLIPETATNALRDGVEREIEQARQAIGSARSSHPDYFRDHDDILDRILVLLDGAIGPEPDEEQRKELLKEADRRQTARIPPGYLDAAKGDQRAAGDYLMWAQILAYAKDTDAPIVFVTSERKDDWWDKHLGRLVGPRHELMEEVSRVTSRRLVFYERKNFVEEWARRQGTAIESTVLHEIRTLQAADDAIESGGDIESLAESVLDRFASDLVESDEQITSLMAETNATGYGLDQIDIISVGPLDLGSVRIPFSAFAYYSGDQLEDRMFFGNSITAHISGELAYVDGEWDVADYEIQAEIPHPED